MAVLVAEGKQCPGCLQFKPKKEFSPNKKRPDGLQVYCRWCHNKRRQASRARSKKYQPPPPQATQVYEVHMMAEELFREFYNNKELREFIRRTARRYSRRHDLQEDFIQEAWIRISMCPANLGMEAMKCAAFRAIKRAWQKEWMQRTYSLSDEETMDRAEYEMWRRGVYHP